MCAGRRVLRVTSDTSAAKIPYLHRTYSQRTPHIHSGHIPTLIQQNPYRSQSNPKSQNIPVVQYVCATEFFAY